MEKITTLHPVPPTYRWDSLMELLLNQSEIFSRVFPDLRPIRKSFVYDETTEQAVYPTDGRFIVAYMNRSRFAHLEFCVVSREELGPHILARAFSYAEPVDSDGRDCHSRCKLPQIAVVDCSDFRNRARNGESNYDFNLDIVYNKSSDSIRIPFPATHIENRIEGLRHLSVYRGTSRIFEEVANCHQNAGAESPKLLKVFAFFADEQVWESGGARVEVCARVLAALVPVDPSIKRMQLD